jgi:uncharacterized protein involved in tellurium resistance
LDDPEGMMRSAALDRVLSRPRLTAVLVLALALAAGSLAVAGAATPSAGNPADGGPAASPNATASGPNATAPVAPGAPPSSTASLVGDGSTVTRDAARLGFHTGISGSLPLAAADTAVHGAGANESFGSAVAAGDVNGDGETDLVVGAPHADRGNASNVGAVYVFYGPVAAGNLSARNASLTLYGATAGDWAGYAVATTAFDDDPYADLVVGAPLNDSAGSSSGAVYVVRGNASLAGTYNLTVANYTFPGAAAGDLAGFSVADAGNVTGNATNETLVGAPRNDSVGQDAGAAYLLSNDSLAEGTRSLADAPVTVVGAAEGDLAGFSVDGAGDFDADDGRDLLVGARDNDSTAPEAGAAYVVTDVPPAADRPATVALPDAGVELVGAAGGDRAGTAVSHVGDVNDDGVSDIGVGAPFNDSAGTTAGVAYVVYGNASRAGRVPLGAANLTYFGEAAGDRAGAAVADAGSGDVTCDRYADVLVGAPGNNSTAPDAGAAYLVAGGRVGHAVRNLSEAEAKRSGVGPGDEAGRALAGVGDVTGDGNADVVVAAPRNDTAGNVTDAGAAYVVAGDCPVGEQPSKFQPDVTFDCTSVAIDADRYGPVYVTFADGTHQLFTGHFDGARTFRGTGEHADKVIRSVRVWSKGQWATVRNPDAEACVLKRSLEALKVSSGCRADGGVLTLENPNDVPVNVTVTGPGGFERTVTVEAGGAVEVSGLPDGEYSLAAETAGDIAVDAPLSRTSVSVDCAFRDVQVTAECRGGEGALTLANPNEVSVEVAVTGPDGFRRTVRLAPGESREFTGLADGDYEVEAFTATAPRERVGVTEPSPSFDCRLADVAVSRDCEAGDGVITLRNPNAEPVRVTVTGPDGYRETVTLAGGETVHLADGLPDGRYRLSASAPAPGKVVGVARSAVTIDCDLAPVKVSSGCRGGDGVVELRNPNDVAVQVDVRRADGFRKSVVVDAGETVRVAGLRDTRYDLSARPLADPGLEASVSDASVTVECDLQAAAVEATCQGGDGALRLRNPNAEPVRVSVVGPDGFQRTVTLSANGATRLTGLADGDYRVRAATVAGDVRVAVPGSPVEVACEFDAVGVETTCRNGRGVLALENPNDRRVEVTVTGPDGFERTVTLAPGGTARLDGLEDGDYRLDAQSGGAAVPVAQTRVTVDCVSRVQVEASCRDGRGALALRNPNDYAVAVRVTGPSGYDRTVTLSAGESRTLGPLRDGDYRVRAATTGDPRRSIPVSRDAVTVDCVSQVSVASGCRDGDGTLRLANPDDNPRVRVTVTGPDGFEQQVPLVPSETAELTGLANGEYDVEAVTVGEPREQVSVSRTTVEVDCQPPLEPAEVTGTTCTADGATLAVGNPNDRAVDVAVTGPGGFEERATVEAGDTAEFSGLGDGDYRVRTLDADGDQVGDARSVGVRCPTEPVEVTRQECNESGGVVVVRNPNEEPVQVDVGGPGGFERRVTVDPGESSTFAGLANGDYTITTLSAIDENVYRIGEASVTVDCPPTDPVEVGSTRCTADGGNLTVRNPNDQPVQVVVTGPEGFEETATVEPGTTHTFEELPDGDYEVRTRTPDGGQVGSPQSVTVACPTAAVEADASCDAPGDGNLTVRNSNEEPVAVTVSGPGGFEETVTLDAGATRSFTGLAGGDYTVTTRATGDAGDYRIGETTATVDCPALQAVAASVTCTADGGTLTVENPNQPPVTVVVTGPGGFEERATVEAGDTAEFSGLGDGEYRVRTLGPGGQEVGSTTVQVACPTQAVEIVEQACNQSGGVVTVRNPNEEPVQVDVTGPGGYEQRVTVEAGATETFSGLANGDYTVTTLSAINENVYQIGQAQVTVDCPTLEPVAVASQSCTAAGGSVTVRNPNDAPVQVRVTGPDGFEQTATVQPGGTATFEELPDGEFTVATLSGDGDEVGRTTVTVDCPTVQPVRVTTRCDADGGVLAVENPNEVPVEVTVAGPEGEQTVTVAAGATETLTGLPDGDYRISARTATDDAVEVGANQSQVTVDCPDGVEVASTCDAGTGVVEISNPNDVPVTVVVTAPDGSETRATLQPGQTETLEDVPNGEYTVTTVAADAGYEIATTTVTVECRELAAVEVSEAQCNETGGVLAVRNPNDASVEAVVTGPGGFERRVALDAGEQAAVAGLDNGTYEVRTVTADGREVGGVQTRTVDCPVGVRFAARTCNETGGVLALRNPNDVPVEAVVTGPRQFERRLPLEPDENRTIAGLENGRYAVTTLPATPENRYRINETAVLVTCPRGVRVRSNASDRGDQVVPPPAARAGVHLVADPPPALRVVPVASVAAPRLGRVGALATPNPSLVDVVKPWQ